MGASGSNAIENIFVVLLYITIIIGYVFCVVFIIPNELWRLYSKRTYTDSVEEMPERFATVWYRDLKAHFVLFIKKRK